MTDEEIQEIRHLQEYLDLLSDYYQCHFVVTGNPKDIDLSNAVKSLVIESGYFLDGRFFLAIGKDFNYIVELRRYKDRQRCILMENFIGKVKGF